MSYANTGKRFIDLSSAIIASIFIAPIIFAAAVAIKLSSNGPVFFRQMRVGKSGKQFEIFKLRTMTMNPNRKIYQTYGSEPDVFMVGRILRRLKIDELPQIINVLLGDMSFVGPRPCLPHTYDEMPSWARHRSNVRPGITGLAQVSGNVSLTWEERWRFDVRYMNEMSLSVDIKIIFKTIAVVLLGENRFKEHA